MYKHIISLLLLFFFIFTAASCQTSKNLNDSNTSETTQSDTITLVYLKRNSDICAIVATFGDEYYITETINDKIFTTVDFIPLDWQDKYIETPVITIIEYDSSYIEPENMYILFLSESEDNEGYYLSCGKSSVFSIYYGDIKPLDYKLKKEVKEHWGNDIKTFQVWFSENYKDPALTTENTDNLSESSTLSSEIS